MKVAIITDQHFGARKGSKFLHEYFKKFYDEVFFPYLEESGIKTVIDMGDTFDNRRSIDLWSLEWAKENYMIGWRNWALLFILSLVTTRHITKTRMQSIL